MKTVCPPTLAYDLEVQTPAMDAIRMAQSHQVSKTLLSHSFPSLGLKSIGVLGDGNCLPRSGSFLAFGNEDNHVEIRVRMVQELLLHDEFYLDDQSLAHGKQSASSNITRTYTQFSPKYVPGTALNETVIQQLYQQEVMDVVRLNAFCGMWQVHALASVLGAPIHSLFPGRGPHKADLSRDVFPRLQTSAEYANILWTSTHNDDPQTWWDPNHFVPAFKVCLCEIFR